MRKDYSTWRTKDRQFVTMTNMIREHGDSDVCLEWPFMRRPDGYGTIQYEKRRWRAHRLAFKLTHGRIYRDLQVLHKCDNPACFNPKHLIQGTQADNMRDMDSKGRRVVGFCTGPRGPNPLLRGELSGKSKLTEQQVLEIREIHKTEMYSQEEIAKQFGITQMNVSAIVRRVTWNHI